MKTIALKYAAVFLTVPVSMHLGAFWGTLSNSLVGALLPSLLTVCVVPVFSAIWAHGASKPPARAWWVMLLAQFMIMGLGVWAEVHVLNVFRVWLFSILDAGVLLGVAHWLLPREAP